MKLFNWSTNKRYPNQRFLGSSGNLIGSAFGLTYTVDEFNLFSQVKDYRTDLLNGTNWRPADPINLNRLDYIQFIRLIQKYSTAIFNDFNTKGFAVLARIDGKIFYISPVNYSKSGFKITVKGYPEAEVFEFNEPNFFCGERTIYEKCEPYQKLYNIALSCQKNGMSKSGFVSVISPKTPSGAPTIALLTDTEIEAMEKRISESHGIATSEQNNMLILKREVNINTIQYDFGKLGILETKQLCEEFVCSKLGVPYVLLPSSGQTFANYEQANKILYENHSKYCEYFTNFVKSDLGFSIDYKTIAETGKGIV
jgi:hypothetical protein